MKYKNLTPNLMVADVAKTIAYYRDVLNFEVIESVPYEDKLIFAIVQADSMLLMFQEEQSLKAEYPQLAECSTKAGITLYIQVSDVQTLYDRLKEKVTIVKDLYTTFYESRDFAIEDCNHYILTFSQSKD